ncbi:hypothetical protein AAMO2058_001075200 [Amorphochlora amoebiformis]
MSAKDQKGLHQPNVEGLSHVEGSNVKMRSHIMLKGRPCRVTKASFAQPGKHGHIKCTFFGQDLFQSKKIQHMCTGHSRIEVPIVKKFEIALLAVSPKFFTGVYEGKEISLKFDKEDEVACTAAELFAKLNREPEMKTGKTKKAVVICILQATCGTEANFWWEWKLTRAAVQQVKPSALVVLPVVREIEETEEAEGMDADEKSDERDTKKKKKAEKKLTKKQRRQLFEAERRRKREAAKRVKVYFELSHFLSFV